MAINWRERFVAAFIHFLITLLLAGIAAALIFLVWFPNGIAAVVGGTTLFVLVLGSDLVLGRSCRWSFIPKQKLGGC